MSVNNKTPIKNEGANNGGEGPRTSHGPVHYIRLSTGCEPLAAKAGDPPMPSYFWAKLLPPEKTTARPLNRYALRRPITMNLHRRPLWHPCVVEECLDILRPKLNAMVESGQLPWAWDLGTGRQRKELRILGHSVIERAMGPIREIGATKSLGLPEVVNLILPQSRTVYRSIDLQRMFHLGPELIQNLIASGEIEKVSQALTSTGVNASASFTRWSVAKLLEKRRIK